MYLNLELKYYHMSISHDIVNCLYSLCPYFKYLLVSYFLSHFTML